ncbi:hypothetical protein LCGC14_2724700 [marine sediment metagenome]|uniref:Uncharacterized protein n=1 Tax=marine sediment metagenome TaxID=412755 RepID=A0A0F8Z921_9ZZZZ
MIEQCKRPDCAGQIVEKGYGTVCLLCDREPERVTIRNRKNKKRKLDGNSNKD